MSLDIYTSLENITIEPSIDYYDLYHIAKCMNVQYISGSNSLFFPINSKWIKYFEDNEMNGIDGRQILFIVGSDGRLCGFKSDEHHNGSVLLNSEVTKIQECIARLHFINNNSSPSYEFLKDPVSFELLNNPYTASDGFTYSGRTLYKIFNPKPVPIDYIPCSPFTRERLIRFDKECTNDDRYCMYGIKNHLIQTLISKLFEDKLSILEGGYNHSKRRKSIRKSFKNNKYYF